MPWWLEEELVYKHWRLDWSSCRVAGPVCFYNFMLPPSWSAGSLILVWLLWRMLAPAISRKLYRSLQYSAHQLNKAVLSVRRWLLLSSMTGLVLTYLGDGLLLSPCTIVSFIPFYSSQLCTWKMHWGYFSSLYSRLSFGHKDGGCHSWPRVISSLFVGLALLGLLKVAPFWCCQWGCPHHSSCSGRQIYLQLSPWRSLLLFKSFSFPKSE